MTDNDEISIKLRALRYFRKKKSAASCGCPDDEVFSAFMDGLLPEKDAAQIRTHIATCPECHAVCSALRETEQIEGPPVPAEQIARAKALRPPHPATIVLRLLKGALEVVKLSGLSEAFLPQGAAEPVRSGDGRSPLSAEIVELAPEGHAVEQVVLQKIEPSDVRITVKPRADMISKPDSDSVFRIDLLKGDDLLQSWPVEADTLSLEPVTTGRYTMQVLQLETRSGGYRSRTLGLIDLDLQA